MAEDRDKILNELIKYYDGDNKQSGAEDMESTRVIGKPAETEKPAPVTDGDTVTVKLTKQTGADSGDDAEMSSTRRIGAPDIQTPGAGEEKKPPRLIQEEVLGNLGIDGRPISIVPDIPEPPREKPAPKPQPAQKPQPVPDEPVRTPESERIQSRYGIWHTLKPLWVTLIVCAVLFCGFKFYMTDTGIIGAYKRNFEYNMTLLLDLFGIDLDSLENDSPVIGEQSGSYVTLANDEELIRSFGTTAARSEEADGTESILVVSGAADTGAEEVSQYREIKGGTVTVPFEGADSSDFSLSKDGVVCAKSNYICCIDENGKTVWEYAMPVTNPIISTAGKYTAAASDGSTQLCVFENGKLLYSTDADDNIVACDISERGDTVLITNKNGYKGAVAVYNKHGEKIFSWASGTNYITAASMLKTRLAAVALVSAVSDVTSYVMLFDVSSPEPISGYELENTLIFDVGNNGRFVFPTGDNCIASLSGYSGINYDMRFDDARLFRAALDSRGNRLVAYTRGNVPVINLYDKNGALVYDAAVNSKPDFIDVYGSTILYNSGREIICGKYSDEKPAHYTASMPVRSLMLLNGRAYVIVYGSCLEFVKI